MSVYHEARLNGRLTDERVMSAGGSVRRALRQVKRDEAEWRNALTPHLRTKAYRRELYKQLGWCGVTVYGRKRNQPPAYRYPRAGSAGVILWP